MRLWDVNGMERVQRTKQPRNVVALAVVATIAFLAGAVVVGALGPRPEPAAGVPSASPGPTLANRSGQPLNVRCGPLETDLASCFEVIAATSGGSDDPARPVTDIFVSAGSTRAWCAPPDPCISPPPDSYWVTLDHQGGSLSVPVYLGADGWAVGVPVAGQ
jgi:hypothetical protein